MNRVFLLMAEFQAADIPLERVVPSLYGRGAETTAPQNKMLSSLPARDING